MSADPDSESPWAGDSIPVAEPVQLSWDHLQSAGSQPRRPLGSAPAGSPPPPFPPPVFLDGTIESGSQHPPSPSSSRRSRALVLAAAATALTLVVGGSIWLASDSEPDEQAAVVPPATITRAAPAPSPGVATPTTTSTSVPPTTSPSETDPDVPPDEPPAPIDRIELPPVVAANQIPTEVVALSNAGVLHTVSLPDGAVTSVDLVEFGFDVASLDLDNASLVVTPSVSYLGESGGATYLIDRDGQVLIPDFGPTSASSLLFPFGWVGRLDGSTAVLAVGFEGADGTETWFAVGDDATVEQISTQPFDRFSIPVTPNGQYVINDTGGAYRVGLDGQATRVSSGRVLAVTPTHLMFRECDDARSCGIVVVSVSDGARLVVEPSAAALISQSIDVVLSPDGTAVALTPAESDRLAFVDLATGEQTAVDDTTPSFGHRWWASDGSGAFGPSRDRFSSGGGLRFFDRASGTTIDFGQELGILTAVGVRYPETLLDG